MEPEDDKKNPLTDDADGDDIFEDTDNAWKDDKCMAEIWQLVNDFCKAINRVQGVIG